MVHGPVLTDAHWVRGGMCFDVLVDELVASGVVDLVPALEDVALDHVGADEPVSEQRQRRAVDDVRVAVLQKRHEEVVTAVRLQLARSAINQLDSIRFKMNSISYKNELNRKECNDIQLK